MQRILQHRDSLTPKGKILGDFDVLRRDDTGFMTFVIEYLFSVIHDTTVMARETPFLKCDCGFFRKRSKFTISVFKEKGRSHKAAPRKGYFAVGASSSVATSKDRWR